MKLRISGVVRGTEVNGPGRRNMVHVQGCSLQCPGCFNPHTWDSGKGESIPTEELAASLLSDQPDGITISGGEPMEQPEALYELLWWLRDKDPSCSILLYTGFTRSRLERSVWWERIRSKLDVVVAGPYMRDRPSRANPLISSANQELMLLGRHTLRELASDANVEVLVEPDGTITMTGFPTHELIRDMEAT